MAVLSEGDKKRTVWLWGKPYHWELDHENMHSLRTGPTEFEQIRMDVADMLIKKGMPVEAITQEIIEQAVAKAETAAIMEAVSE